METSIEGIEARLTGIEREQRVQDKALSSISATMARLDERTEAMKASMERLEIRLSTPIVGQGIA